jgi:two-component system CheB/CheR fusion protein
VEALSTLMSTIPSDFPVPIVIAQHLDPLRPSHLAEILGSRGPLPVHTILERDALQNGHVYVVPADRHVEIADGHLTLRTNHVGRPKPSVDLLFRTAAEVYGDGVIAVILTGSGSDGSAGALEVKKAGGTVIIQNPATAAFPSMPRSLAPTVIDFAVNMDEIGALLYDLVTNSVDFEQPNETKALQSFLQLVHERSGLDFTAYKEPTIQRRLQRRIVATGSSSLAGYRRYLQRHPEEYARLISSFLIKVTEFFRDRDLFTLLRNQILPELIEEARQRGNELRLWSAGCATGEEAYSLAILVAEALGEDLEQFTVRIFATDLDNDAINYARRGVYPSSALNFMPREMVARYFQHVNGEYEVDKRVRSLVIFGQHDLGQRAPFPRIDLILCRNVLIYFTLELQKRVLQLFAYSLRDGGYLALGKAETTSPLAEFFTVAHPNLKVYRRQGERLLIPLGQFKDTTPMRATAVRARGWEAALAPTREVTRVRSSMEKLGSVVFNLPIGVVVVDRHYDIQIINSLAHQLLEIHRSALGEDLLHLADQVPTKALRAIIDAALAGESVDPTTDIVQILTETHEQRHLQITGYPHQMDDDAGEAPVASVLLLVTDVTEQVERQRRDEQQRTNDPPATTAPQTQETDPDLERLREENSHLSAQVQQLMAVNRELRDANHGLTATNIELHQANEEYLVNTEEVQAAAEEVETLNEELQATNEELETLNEELQATVEELNATNDDLEARSGEMLDLARRSDEQRQVSEAERAQLSAILVGMGDAVLVVDPEGKTVLTNEAYTRILGDPNTMAREVEDDEGRPIPLDAQPRARAARGETFTLTFTLATGDQRRWFEAIGQPLDGGDRQLGGVVVIRDITDRSLRRLQEEFLTLVSHELRTPLTSTQLALQNVLKMLGADPASESLRRQAALALRQVQHLNTMVGDLVDVARIQTWRVDLNQKPIILNEVVVQATETARLLANDHQTIQVTMPEEPLRVNGDAQRLRQILFNLLTNAMLHASDSKEISVQLQRRDAEAVILVRDQGLGIPAENIPHLFERFYRVESSSKDGKDGKDGKGGLGLGLYIAKQLVESHGGTITASSNDGAGAGATFTVTLPLLP